MNHLQSTNANAGTVRLTMAQALVRYLCALEVESDDGTRLPYCAGVWAIFGHGNVAGLGEALQAHRDALPTYRAHNEQAMAHAAIAYAKAQFRRRIMAVTTSIGPGATNLLTAAATAHVNRLPVLLLPGDVFASRAPDPVLQQLEDFHQGDLSVNDAFRPLTRYFDRILRPEQILAALPRAIQAMTDPANCGPACLALPQDVQTEAFDCPVEFLAPEPIRFRCPQPDPAEFERALALLRGAQRPLIVAGGGVLYAGAARTLEELARRAGVPVAETQAGKGSLAWDHPQNLGAIGVTGSPAANEAAREADVVLAVGTRLQDFVTGSHTLFPRAQIVALNVAALDAHKWHAQPLVADARAGLARLDAAGWTAPAAWADRARDLAAAWRARVDALTTAVPHEPDGPPRGRIPERAARSYPSETRPYDAEVIGAVRDSAADSPGGDIVVCAGGTLPGELHKLWRTSRPGGYHLEYGYSCMGYEIAGGIGVKLARPDAEVVVMIGDGSYLMLNSEIATSVMLGRKLIVVVLDNHGFGCIQRLQTATGGARFNNLLGDCVDAGGIDVKIDFAAHAASLGAEAVHVAGIAELRAAMVRARAAQRTQVLVIDTTHERTTADGGWWWEVAVPEVSARAEVAAAKRSQIEGKHGQRS